MCTFSMLCSVTKIQKVCIIYVYIYYIKPIILLYSLIIDGNKINKDTSVKVDKNKLFYFIVIAKQVRATTSVI